MLIEFKLIDEGEQGFSKNADVSLIAKKIVHAIWETVEMHSVWREKHVIAEICTHDSFTTV